MVAPPAGVEDLEKREDLLKVQMEALQRERHEFDKRVMEDNQNREKLERELKHKLAKRELAVRQREVKVDNAAKKKQPKVSEPPLLAQPLDRAVQQGKKQQKRKCMHGNKCKHWRRGECVFMHQCTYAEFCQNQKKGGNGSSSSSSAPPPPQQKSPDTGDADVLNEDQFFLIGHQIICQKKMKK